MSYNYEHKDIDNEVEEYNKMYSELKSAITFNDGCVSFVEVSLPELEGVVENGFGIDYQSASEDYKEKLYYMIKVLQCKENALLDGTITPRLVVE